MADGKKGGCDVFDSLLSKKTLILPSFGMNIRDAPETVKNIERLQGLRDEQAPDKWIVLGTLADFSDEPTFRKKGLKNFTTNSAFTLVDRITKPKIEKIKKEVCSTEDFWKERAVEGQPGVYRLF